MSNEELVKDYQNGNESSFNILLEQNKGLICTNIAKWLNKVQDGTISYTELESECVYCFFVAVKTYNIEKETSFSTWAFQTISWHLKNMFLRKLTNTKNIVSIDDKVPGTDDLTVGDTIKDEEAELFVDKILSNEEKKQLYKELRELLKCVLTEQEQMVLKKYYGIDCKQCSYSQIANVLGVSGTRIGQIISAAIKKLKESPNTQIFGQKYDLLRKYSQQSVLHTKRITNKKINIAFDKAVSFFEV